MKWLNFWVNIVDGKNDKKCPICGENEAHYRIHIISPEDRAGYVHLWCDSCKSKDYLSFRNLNDNLLISA